MNILGQIKEATIVFTRQFARRLTDNFLLNTAPSLRGDFKYVFLKRPANVLTEFPGN